ncbi:WD domain-containing protein 34 [Elsinoe fawcettii]|nr:WD domain-containing protein 34 [Elsinoe fawcettii]
MSPEVIDLVSDDEDTRVQHFAPLKVSAPRQQRPAFQSPRAKYLAPHVSASSGKSIGTQKRPLNLDDSSEDESLDNLEQLWGLNEAPKQRIKQTTNGHRITVPGPEQHGHTSVSSAGIAQRPCASGATAVQPKPYRHGDARHYLQSAQERLKRPDPVIGKVEIPTPRASISPFSARPRPKTDPTPPRPYLHEAKALLGNVKKSNASLSSHGYGFHQSGLANPLAAAPLSAIQQPTSQTPRTSSEAAGTSDVGLESRKGMSSGTTAALSRTQALQQPTSQRYRSGNVQLGLSTLDAQFAGNPSRRHSDLTKPTVSSSVPLPAVPRGLQEDRQWRNASRGSDLGAGENVRKGNVQTNIQQTDNKTSNTLTSSNSVSAVSRRRSGPRSRASTDDDSIPAKKPGSVLAPSHQRAIESDVRSSTHRPINHDQGATIKKRRRSPTPPDPTDPISTSDEYYEEDALKVPAPEPSRDLSMSYPDDGLADTKVIFNTSAQKQVISAGLKPGGFKTYSEEDNELLYKLKKVQGLPWAQIMPYFPERSRGSLQVHWSTKVQHQARDTSGGMPPVPPRSTRMPSKSSYIPASATRPDRSGLADPESAATPSRMSLIRGLRRRATGGASKQPTRASSKAEVDSDSDQGKQEKVLGPQYQLLRCHRNQELGLGSARSRNSAYTHSRIRNLGYESLGPSKYIDDASGDVATVSWSPDDRFFAGGAVVLSDANSMQYNRPRNLLVGDQTGQVRELPDHHVQRPVVDKGVNASHSMRETQDPRMFTTVQMVGFSPDSARLHAVSMDGKLSSYVLENEVLGTELEGIYQHDAQVDLLTISQHTGLIATGERSATNRSIRILHTDAGNPPRLVHAVGSKDAGTGKPIYPSALKWGTAAHQSKYILAGFAQEKQLLYADDDAIDIEGESCLIDCETGQRIEFGYPRNVFDVAWNPRLGHTAFVVASVGFGKLNHGMKTIIRLFGEGQAGLRSHVELECPARDINDVIYSPFDDNLISAGSTDGKVYLWDIRFTKSTQEPLRTFTHGSCLSVLPHERKRWEADTGIRFLSYGGTRDRLFSGSSDGVVKVWNPYVANEDSHVKDLIKFSSAIMSGAFSSDATKLLVGEDQGRLNLLEIGREDVSLAEAERFDFIPAPEPEVQEEPLWRKLVTERKVEFKPHGASPIRQAVQGPGYVPSKTMLTKEEAGLHIQAAKFQKELWHQRNRWKKMRKRYVDGGPKIKACELDCGYLPKGDGEVEASGRAEERVPGQLRLPAPEGLRAAMKGLIAICGSCGDKCLPAEKGEARCERCGFGCFRCGKQAKLDLRSNTVHCKACDLTWDIGILGYEVMINDETKPGHSSFTPPALDKEFGDDERDRHFEQVL